MNIKNKISVVIPARDSQETIGWTIESILKQSLQPFEIIVVCSKKDLTLGALAKYKNNKLIKVIKTTAPQDYVRDAHYKRWIGANESRGTYIFLTDSKAILEKNALELALSFTKKYKVEAVAGVAEAWINQRKRFISKVQDKALIKNNPRFPDMKILNISNFGKTESLPVTTALFISRNAFKVIKNDFALEYSKIASTYDDYVTAWLLVKNNIDILLTRKIISYHKHRLDWKHS